MRTEIQTGVSDGEWIEVTNLQRPTASNVEHPWTPINGSEQVILGDLSILADGGPVEVAPATGEAKVASATPSPGRRPTKTRRTRWHARLDLAPGGDRASRHVVAVDPVSVERLVGARRA